jgi:putative PEP-CTERM system TPR-repeat lipoprotein
MRKVLLLACVAGLSLALSSQPIHAANERSERLLADARRQLERGDIRAAIIQLRNALRADSTNVPARFELGMASFRIGDAANAETFLDQAREGGFEPARVLPPLGAVLLTQGHFDRALAIFTPGDRAPPALEAEVRRIRGAALSGLGRLNEAEQVFREALAIQQTAGLHIGLARIAASRRNAEEVRSQIDQALALDPDYSDALLARADMRRGSGDLNGALEDIAKVIAHDERNVLARVQRAAIEIQQGQLDQANTDIDAALAVAPGNPYVLYHRALARFRAGDIAAATQVMQEIQAFVNDYVPALYLQGVLNYAQNRMEQAKGVLSRALVLSPDSLPARRLLGAVELRMGEVQQAYDVAREGLQRYSPDDAGLLGLIGEASLRLGHNDEAAQYFERGLQAPGANSAMTTGLAIANIGAGRSDVAIDQLEHLLARDPNAAQAAQLLIVSYVRSRQFDRAVGLANDLKQRFPASPLPELYLGVIAGAQGNPAESETHFRAALAMSPDFAPAAVNLASIQVAQNKLEDAETTLRALLGRVPNNIRIMIMLAEVSGRRNQPDAVVDWLTRATQADPTALEPKLRLMGVYLGRNEAARALPILTDVMNLAPSNPQALEMAGRVYLAANDNSNAVATFRRLVSVASRSAGSLYLLGRAQIASGDRDAGRASLDDAIAADRRFVPALADRLNFEYDSAGPEAAIALAQRFRDVDPTSPIPDTLLGDLLWRAGRAAEAAPVYEAAMDKGQAADAAIKAFETRVRLGQAEEAVRRLRAWLDRYPTADAVRFVLANYLIVQHRYDEALQETSTLAADQPSNMVILNNLTWLYGELNDPRALESAERIFALAPNDPNVAGTVGWIYVQHGRASEGLELLRRSAAATPNNRNTKYQLAAVLARGDGATEARQILESILGDNDQFLYRSEAEVLLARLRGQ